jgi:hypothetical protein
MPTCSLERTYSLSYAIKKQINFTVNLFFVVGGSNGGIVVDVKSQKGFTHWGFHIEEASADTKFIQHRPLSVPYSHWHHISDDLDSRIKEHVTR